MDWLDYQNHGTRNLPLSDDLVAALATFIPDLGIERMVVASGGQPARGTGGARTGSTRHDLGGAADADFHHTEYGLLDARIPEHREILAQIVSRGRQAGLTGFGMGMDHGDYMGPHRMHLGYGAPAVWGDDGRGENAPAWLRTAYYGADPGARPDVGPTRARAEAGLPLATRRPPEGEGLNDRKVPGFIRRGNEHLERWGFDTSRQGENRGDALVSLGMYLMNEGF